MDVPPYDYVVETEILPQYSSDIIDSDVLPAYHSGVELRGRLLRKQEFITPIEPALRRNWHRVEAELRGTTLLILKSPSTNSPRDLTAAPTHSYTLQAGDVGLALDYTQRGNVFRLRLEGEQHLFMAPSVETAVGWVESLQIAIAVSEPLEVRRMPRYPSLPPRRTKYLSDKTAIGFWERLRLELARGDRKRREWLVEMPTHSRKDRWMTVLHGQDAKRPRRRTASSTLRSSSESGSNRERTSICLRYQCPCSSCWWSTSHRASVDETHEEEQATSPMKNVELKCLTSSLQHLIQCTKSLPMSAKWNGGIYIKNGRRIKIPVRQFGDGS